MIPRAGDGPGPLPASNRNLRLAIILVHYHTPALAVAAWRALAADLEGSGHEVEWLLVDNGSDEAGRRVLGELPFARIDPGENLGYAGGVNLAAGRSRADVMLLMNPDVLVLPGCVEALLGSLRGGAAAAGPRFYWDAGRRMLLPPPEPRHRRGELLRLLAGRGGRWAARARRLSRRHCRRHWQAREPLPSHALSGSLLAVRRDAWEKVGPFDAGYPLYFEETDWLMRLARAGLGACYVPAAEAVHVYSQSAFQEPRARVWFEESARRFRVRHYGAGFAGALERLGRLSKPAPATAAAPPVPPEGLPLPEPAGAAAPLWVEVSPNAEGFPAAAEPRPGCPPRPAGLPGAAGPAVPEAVPARWTLPAEIMAALPAGTRLWVRVSDDRGRELGCYTLDVPGGSGPRGAGDLLEPAAGRPGAGDPAAAGEAG